MSDKKPATLQTEQTDVGTQTLIDGVAPITLRDRLGLLIEQPLSGPRTSGLIRMAPQKPCNHGFFDEVGRAQLDIFDLIKTHDGD